MQCFFADTIPPPPHRYLQPAYACTSNSWCTLPSSACRLPACLFPPPVSPTHCPFSTSSQPVHGYKLVRTPPPPSPTQVPSPHIPPAIPCVRPSQTDAQAGRPETHGRCRCWVLRWAPHQGRHATGPVLVQEDVRCAHCAAEFVCLSLCVCVCMGGGEGYALYFSQKDIFQGTCVCRCRVLRWALNTGSQDHMV